MIGSQAMHALPLAPHCVTEAGDTHIEPAQQPSHPTPHESEHTPETHSPVSQVSHAEPPLPHALGEVPGLHVLPEQQPVHDVLLHTQLPPLHTWPEPQGAPPPQLQVPDALHPSDFAGSQAVHANPPVPQLASVGGEVHVGPEQQPPAHDVASHTQSPETQRWPVVHAGRVPHAQSPSSLHPSASVESQLVQVSPAVPQVDGERTRH